MSTCFIAKLQVLKLELIYQITTDHTASVGLLTFTYYLHTCSSSHDSDNGTIATQTLQYSINDRHYVREYEYQCISHSSPVVLAYSMAGSDNVRNIVSTLLSKEEKDLVSTIIGDGSEVVTSTVKHKR